MQGESTATPYRRIRNPRASFLSRGSRYEYVLEAKLDRIFKLSLRQTTVRKEVWAGAVSWMTMSYIMVVNPAILSKSDPVESLPLEPLMTATALSAAIGSLLVGVTANAPVALMPGMGLNAYFTYSICHAFEVTWMQGMSCCFVSGVALAAFALFGLCDFLVKKFLSEHLKRAITVAIGIFQALIGFQVMGFIRPSDDTMLQLGNMDAELLLAIGGFFLVAALLVSKRVYGSILLGIWIVAAISWVTGLSEPPRHFMSMPSFDMAFMVDFSGWLPSSGKLQGMIIGSVVLCFVALFDLAGVQYGLYSIAGLLSKDGSVEVSRQLFLSSALSTIAGSLLGTSPIIIANESSAGIMEGAKTGLSAIVVAVLFALSAFIAPLLAAVPRIATAVPLVIVGAFMMQPCCGIDWDDLTASIPSFIAITVVPFTYSIHNGILAAVIMDTFLWFVAKYLQKESVGNTQPYCDEKPDTIITPAMPKFGMGNQVAEVDGEENREIISPAMPKFGMGNQEAAARQNSGGSGGSRAGSRRQSLDHSSRSQSEDHSSRKQSEDQSSRKHIVATA